MAKQRLGMVIDTARCIGCQTCAMACKFENNLPRGVWWNKAKTIGGSHADTPSGQFPQVRMDFFTFSCQHCDNAPCAKVCPTGATHVREDGIVMMQTDRCIGCRYCMVACPYEGVRNFNWDEPTYDVSHAVGGTGIQEHRKGTVDKCSLCYHRVDAGLEQACVHDCPARARYFGDFADPDSEVSRLIATRDYYQLMPDQGTHPSVYFLK